MGRLGTLGRQGRKDSVLGPSASPSRAMERAPLRRLSRASVTTHGRTGRGGGPAQAPIAASARAAQRSPTAGAESGASAEFELQTPGVHCGSPQVLGSEKGAFSSRTHEPTQLLPKYKQLAGSRPGTAA